MNYGGIFNCVLIKYVRLLFPNKCCNSEYSELLNNVNKLAIFSSVVFSYSQFLALPGIAEVPDLGLRPPTGIHDEAKVLSETQEIELGRRLRKAFDDYALEIYVATYTFIQGESIVERSTRLRNAWARNQYAIAVVFDSSSSQISFVRTHDFDQFLAKPEIEAVFARAATRAVNRLKEQRENNAKFSKGDLLMEAVDGLLLDPILAHNLQPSPRFKLNKDMGGLLAGLIVLGLAVAGFVFFQERRFASKKAPSFKANYFPRANMPIRLGGPNSGGMGVTLEV